MELRPRELASYMQGAGFKSYEWCENKSICCSQPPIAIKWLSILEIKNEELAPPWSRTFCGTRTGPYMSLERDCCRGKVHIFGSTECSDSVHGAEKKKKSAMFLSGHGWGRVIIALDSSPVIGVEWGHVCGKPLAYTTSLSVKLSYFYSFYCIPMR